VLLEIINQSLFFLIISALLGFILTPVLINLLQRWRIVRTPDQDVMQTISARQSKLGTPVMGGLLVVIVVALVTILFNWDRRFTWVPIGVMAISAFLGGLDDLLNIFGRYRRIRTVARIKKLMRVHRYWSKRIWFALSLPMAHLRRFFYTLGSVPGKGVQVHEKLFFQLIAGAVAAWWLYFKLGPQWQLVWVPFNGELSIGWLLIPIVILIVVATANAVNVADGLDGLAGGSLITGFAGLMIIAWLEGNIFFAILNSTVMGALLAYTYFNVKPARFQMGDVGSLGLGALLAVMTIAQNRILILPLLGFIFFVELASVVIQVFGKHVLGRRIFKLAPLHHHFELLGWSEEKIVERFWIVNGLAVLIGVWLSLH
jgi:phospho-N-acetylmuramoyl-pentapeptide-transferase